MSFVCIAYTYNEKQNERTFQTICGAESTRLGSDGIKSHVRNQNIFLIYNRCMCNNYGRIQRCSMGDQPGQFLISTFRSAG
jgi:hypothetical protein